jgi:phosphoserine phosphatase
MDGDEPATDEMRELEQARKGIPHGNGARSRDEIAAFFGDMTLVPPGLTELWAWHQDRGHVMARSDVMTFLGGVAKKD